MCLCTQYDSPTCGHSWISMSQPCGFCQDLLNCPHRQVVQALVAPAMTCPQCNGGFADGETLQMIQGPWGCNQMVRSHVGGNAAIPGAWGGAQLQPQHWGVQPAMPGDWCAGDARLTGPYSGPPGPQPLLAAGWGNNQLAYDGFGHRGMGGAVMGDYHDDGQEQPHWAFDDRSRRRRRSSHHYREYRRSIKAGPGCIVM